MRTFYPGDRSSSSLSAHHPSLSIPTRRDAFQLHPPTPFDSARDPDRRRLQTLSTLSLGNNELDALEQLSPLTAFKEIRVLNLGGNGACKDPEYRAFVLSHVKGLKYLGAF